MGALYIYLPETPGSCIFVDNVYETTSQSGGGKTVHEFMKYYVSIHLHSSYDNISLKFLFFSAKLSFLLRISIFTLKTRQQDMFKT